ncbi:MAG: HEAT repeat domain-containing protein, partial [Bacteroidota bacterium]
MRNYWLLLSLIFILTRCVPPTEEKFSGVNVDITNPEIQALYDLQNKGLTDSLLPYFRHKNPTYRYLSALAFASIKDSLAVKNLWRLLLDPVDEVRIAAAYSLGQIGHPSAQDSLLGAFDRNDTVGVSRFFNAAIMEAIGKCGTDNMLDAL